MIYRIYSLILKELIGIWRDPKSRIAILIPPITQLFIFTFAATLDVKHATIGIVNRDSGEKAFELIERFRGSPFIKEIVYLPSVHAIDSFIDRQEGIMAISFDETFSRKLDSGKRAQIQLIFDGRKSNTAQIVAGYSTTIIQNFEREIEESQGIEIEKTRLVQRNWYNPNILYYWYNVPCLVSILSMLTCLIVTSLSVARERELGTFDQLLVSPLIPFEILVGKIVPGILIGQLEGSLILLIGVFIFGVPFTGSAILFYLCLFIFVSAISGAGLFISSLCSTQQQAILGTFVFMVPSVLLSGFATPIENMPEWLQPLTYAMPLRYMLVIAKGIFLKEMPASIVFGQAWPMVLIAILSVFGAGRFFRRRLG